jgi:penicillin amidase
MARTHKKRSPFRSALRVLGAVLLLLVLLAGGVLGYGAWVMRASEARLEGTLALPGLSAPVTIVRDANGVPTVTAGNRADLARGLGFLHGQERFFEMDLLRRAGAGELSALVGAGALPMDRHLRLQRFRHRAELALAKLTPAERAVPDAYVAGVNAGLAALGHAPWEYTLLRVTPRPWTAADSYLVVYAMYFDLQPSSPEDQEARALSASALGPQLAAFLDPRFTPHDAPIDGAMPPPPPMPTEFAVPAGVGAARPAAPEHGSNNMAVSGALTSTGSGMMANDMHLSLTVPNIWYRARLVVPGALNLIGVTLPGEPFLVVGSNTHVAWGFTDAYMETGDAVLLDLLPGDKTRYQTPDGPKPITMANERICVAHAACQTLTVAETIWGPIEDREFAGHKVVWAWTAHDANAVMTDGFTGLEQAQNVPDALAAAHRAGLPQENLAVVDSAGHVAWTIIGQVPRRVGPNDQMPHSWADGTHGWKGYLPPEEVPAIVDPPDGRVWTANARVVGGEALEKIGDGGYVDGQRAGRIRDDLNARRTFTEADLLAIETDTRSTPLDSWQKLMLAAIDAHRENAAMRPYVENWGGHAVPGSVGYRLVRDFRAEAIRLVYQGLTAPVAAKLDGGTVPVPYRAAWPVEQLLTAAPAGLVPAPYKSWNDVTGAILAKLAAAVARGGGTLADFTWGKQNHTGIHHPLAQFIPLLGLLTDPPDVPVAGDSIIPRVVVPGDGASERLVVSPGHEDTGLFDMPVGQAANPLEPYFGAGEQDWVEGKGTPLLPGAEKWRLVLTPGG